MNIFKSKPSHWYRLGSGELGLVDSFFVKRNRQLADFNRRMFDEDFARLFNSLNRQNSDLFRIVSNDDELVAKLFGKGNRVVNKRIRDLVDEIAQSLVWHGRAYYWPYDDEERRKIQIVSLSPDGIVRFFGRYFQWVPRHREKPWDKDDEELPREIRMLDAEKIIRFDMPVSIKRLISRQNRVLAVLDKHKFKMSDFQSQSTHEDPNPPSHFDYRKWSDIQDRALYRATRITGWNGRRYDSAKRSDFFDCHRLIRFRRNQLLLRDDILKQLSRELSRIGKYYKAEFAVEISTTDELLSVAALNELESRLSREEVGFSDVLDYCYKG